MPIWPMVESVIGVDRRKTDKKTLQDGITPQMSDMFIISSQKLPFLEKHKNHMCMLIKYRAMVVIIDFNKIDSQLSTYETLFKLDNATLISETTDCAETNVQEIA